MSKKSRLDLLVRVRYLNPLPPPPFPPKLFNIPTDINRLGEPSYLNHLAASTPLPMLVDSEMGMALDLNPYEGVWDGNDMALNAVSNTNRSLHPADVALLGPVNHSNATNGWDKAPTVSEVSWMRNSNLFMRKTGARRREAADSGERQDASVDASEAAQIMAIEKTFMDVSDREPEDVRHPNGKKKHLRVVESYDILPDEDTWPNSYIMIRFPERPSAATASNPSASASSPRLARAMLRPVKEDDQQILEYFLPPEEDVDKVDLAFDRAIAGDRLDQLQKMAAEEGSNPEIDEIFPNVHYDRIRTYEVVSQILPNKEVLMAFREETSADEAGAEGIFDEPMKKRRKGVYYNNIGMRTLLRKTRAKRRGEAENREDLWDKTRVGFREPQIGELKGREEKKQSVIDPSWVNDQLRGIQGGENMAEGQGEAIDDEEIGVDEGAERAEDDVDEDD